MSRAYSERIGCNHFLLSFMGLSHLYSTTSIVEKVAKAIYSLEIFSTSFLILHLFPL
jgi:hypothetical protein